MPDLKELGIGDAGEVVLLAHPHKVEVFISGGSLRLGSRGRLGGCCGNCHPGGWSWSLDYGSRGGDYGPGVGAAVCCSWGAWGAWTGVSGGGLSRRANSAP